MTQALQTAIEAVWNRRDTLNSATTGADRDAVEQALGLLDSGRARVAEPTANGWQVNQWLKQAVLLSFRLNDSILMPGPGGAPVFDKVPMKFEGWGLAEFQAAGFRAVPGAVVRRSAYIAPSVVLMPSFVNVGAYVDEGTMVDSHALVGSCAQIGKRVHLSAAAQIGGVLEPVNASPVIIEDDVLVGGNTGVYEGTIVRSRAVLAAGTILTRGTPVYDLVTGEVLKATAEMPLIIPAGAVVVPGSRAVARGKGAEWGLSVYAPVIVKYRDEKTDLSTTLEDLLR